MANSSARYASAAIRIVPPVSIAASSQLATPIDDQREHGDERRPDDEHVRVEQRDAAHRLRPIENRENRIAEQQASEDEDGDQPLANDASSDHGASFLHPSPRPSPSS